MQTFQRKQNYVVYRVSFAAYHAHRTRISLLSAAFFSNSNNTDETGDCVLIVQLHWKPDNTLTLPPTPILQPLTAQTMVLTTNSAKWQSNNSKVHKYHT